MNTKWTKDFNQLISMADQGPEVELLLNALLTPVEREELAKRWQIVKLLIEENTQRNIRDELNVSIATVTRGSRELKYGNGTLQKFYKRLYPSKSAQKNL